MAFLGSALGLTAMCSLGWGNLVEFDWNDFPVGRKFDCKCLKKVKSPPHALPPPPHPAPPAGITLIGALRKRGFSRSQGIKKVIFNPINAVPEEIHAPPGNNKGCRTTERKRKQKEHIDLQNTGSLKTLG